MLETLKRYWLAVIVVVGLIASVADASHLAAQNEKDSIARSVNTCERSNPTRAYFLLRAKEVTSIEAQFASGYVFAILNCQATVVHHGEPQPVPAAVQARYLLMFRQGRVPTLEGDRIVGSVSFPTYFDGRN